MSDRFGLKVKENAGKTKYSSLNLNQTYKGTKVETKTSSGTARHGLQSLGKVGASRRIPPPANLPSLKSENSGNDPTVSLVPSGGGGWGSAKEKPSETPSVATSQAAPSSTSSQVNVPTSQQPLLQPQRSIPPPSHPQPVQQPQSQNSGQTQAQPVKQQQQECQAKTWGNISSNGAGGPEKTYSHQEMPYFNREFPVLGGGNLEERLPPHMEEKEHSQYGPKPMMRNMHEPPWMERSGPEYGPGRERSDMYNGGPVSGYTAGPQYRRPLDYQHGQYGKNYPTGYPHHHGNGPYGHGPGAGRHPHGYPPDYYSRGPVHRPGAVQGAMHRPLDKGRGEGYGRPAILKPEDIQAMDDNEEEEEGGWAGAQDEVDYAAKLDFEDFDEDEKPSAERSREKSNRDASGGEPESRWQSTAEGRSGKETASPSTRQAWSESQAHPHGYSDGRQVPPGPGMRPFDSRSSPPAPGWPMSYPQHLSSQPREGGPPVHPSHQGSPDQAKPVSMEGEPVVNEWQKRRVKQQEEMRAAVERARKRREEDEMKRQAEQKAAATAKLKELEMKRIRRESAKDGEDAWAEELDSIEKESKTNRESFSEPLVPETSRREHETHSTATNQQDGVFIRSDVFEHGNRQRNDSESSDASRSSASRGTSRAYHHPPRDIPPRFQQQQLRQQQQQHFQPHYQQQQPPQQYQYHQQLARSPHLREFPEGPLAVNSHHSVVETGPVSPSQPVRRIMKRSDSSSTAGDDIASVKSLEGGSGEPTRETENRSPAAPTAKAEVAGKSAKEGQAAGLDSSRIEKKQVDYQEVPTFDEADSLESRDSTQTKKQEPDKPMQSESDKEKEVNKERESVKTDSKGSIDGATESVLEKSRTVSDKVIQARERQEERRSSKWDARSQDGKRSEESKDLGKRKREDSEDLGRVPERRGRFAGRGDYKRERFSEPHGRGRVSYPVRGRGRGMGSNVTSHRGRGRGERGGRDSREFREFREYRPPRSHELKASPSIKSDKGGQKQEEGKENVPVKENSSKPENEKPAIEITGKAAEDVTMVKQEKKPEISPSIAEKEAVVLQDTDKTPEEKKSDAVIEEKKTAEGESRTTNLPDKEGEKSKRTDDSKTKSEINREATTFKPRGRGGFGKPPRYSQDSRSTGVEDKRPGGKKFTDKKRNNFDRGRDRNDYYEQKRPTRSFSRDQTSQKTTARDNRNWEKSREKDQKLQSHHDEGETRSKRHAQEDRRKRTSEKDDDQQYSRSRTEDKNQRGGYRSSYSTRGRFAKNPVRTGMRGGRSNQPVGSGRFGNNYRRSKSTDEDLSDDYDSDSSSYTTATSASEERRDENPSEIVEDTDVKRSKDSSYEKSRADTRSTRPPIRGKVSSRAGGRGSAGFGRSRREVERPPRFQKQQERERASMARGVSRVDRESGPGRGRGRGRRDQRPRDVNEGPGMPVTEDWDEEIKDKEAESSKADKPAPRKEASSKRGFSGPRSSSDRTRNERSRESGGTRNSSRREPFLVERQQAKVEGSKSGGGEPRVPLPAARNGFSKEGNRRTEIQGHSHGTGLDNINTGASENRASRKQETPLRTTDIKQFDLHNIAGVICIDDMTDDDSDISSTLSGFVEVTSRRTQKENKDRQREEEERRKKADEQNRLRNNQVGHKKNQSSKPPRFSKQHAPQANSHSKSSGVIGKATSAIVSEAVAGLPNATSNSNPSSGSSTKRNSPVTVERPVSPPPPPVFNAWDKPLIVTPAKPPSAIPPAPSSVPDPLAVGSGKPSSSRPVESGTVISSTASLIEDISVDEDYIAMTKEIALLAPPEEPEEVEGPSDSVTKPKAIVNAQNQTSEKAAKVIDDSEKRSQPKPQREKPPRYDKSGKRKVAGNSDVTKKEQPGGAKGRKSSRESQTTPKLQNKPAADKNVKGKTATSGNAQQQSVSPEKKQILDGVDAKEVPECVEYDASNVENISATASDEGSEEKEGDLKDGEEQESKDDSESESSRKDSEPDLNVDSPERNDDADNLFSSSSLAVDVHERSTTDRPVREPSPVSPAIFEMSKKMEASRKLWEGGLGIGRASNPVTAWEETLRTPASVGSSIVGMPVVEAKELRLNDDQVAASKSQELEINSSKTDSKASDGISFTKKSASGEQQNVCKVKPQQQQQPPVKPPQSTSLVSQATEENLSSELNTVPLGQPLLTQDQLLAQQAITSRYAFPYVSPYMDLQQRQSYLHQQQLQQLQQPSQQVTPTYPLTHVQQVSQARSSSSPLSQTPQDLYQSSFMAGGVYSAGNFQGTQPFVSIALLPSTTTQSFVTSTTRTQTTSLIGLQAQPPKTVNGSVFAQNVNAPGGQMYMPFDPKTLSGGTQLFNLAQHPQTSQRQILGAQSGIVGDNAPRQAGFPTAQASQHSFHGAYPFQQKQSTYEVSQDIQVKKTSDQSDFSRQSELVKHVNAKPFEPPKRSTQGSVSGSNPAIGPLVSSTFPRNPNLVTIRPSPQDIGGTSQSPPVSSSLISGRPVSMSPVDPVVPFPGAVGSFPKHTAVGQFQVQQQPQGVQPQQFTPFQQQPVGIQHTLQIRAPGQQQQQAINPLQGAAATMLPNPAVMAAAMPRQLIRTPGLSPMGLGGAQPTAPNAQRFPAPIQRPLTTSLMHGVPHMQAPRSQTAPPQMVRTSQQMMTNRPQMQQPSVSHQNQMASAFKLEQHQKMLEQTKMFFAQQGQQQQQRVPTLNTSTDQQPKVAPTSQGERSILKGQLPKETNKLQDKKEETNPRNRKTNPEANKTSKTTKVDSKPDESSKNKSNPKQDGKGTASKSSISSSGIVRIQPLPITQRGKPNKGRGPPRMTVAPANKPKLSGRPEKESKDSTALEQPSGSPSPKTSDQARAPDVQPVPPPSVNKA